MKWPICILALAGSLFAQTVNTDILPASTGLRLGSSNQRWKIYAQSIDLANGCTINGQPCSLPGLVQVNATAVTLPNFNNTLPAATAGNTLCSWQTANFQVSVQCPQGAVNWAIPGTLGATTPNTGVFTTMLAKIVDSAIYSITAYGAKCDGSTDDSTSINAAITAAANGGTIVFPGSASGCFSSSTITVATDGITFQGAGFAFGSNSTPSKIVFPSGVSGVVASGRGFRMKDMYLLSQSTGAGSDVGLLLDGPGSYMDTVTVDHFGSHCIITDSTSTNADHWFKSHVSAINCFGDGFRYTGASDTNVGQSIGDSARSDGGIGFNIVSGASTNNFYGSHAATNVGGDYAISSGQSNTFYFPYCESGTGSSFTFGTGASWNYVIFPHFGLCTTISNSGASSTSNLIFRPQSSFWGTGSIAVSPDDPSASGRSYVQRSGASCCGANDWDLEAQGVGVVLQFNAAAGQWVFPSPYQIRSTIATGTPPLVVASATNIPNLNASTLSGNTFSNPGPIGGGTPNSVAATTISASGQVTSTIATGTAPIVAASTTPVANLTATPTTYNAAGTQQVNAHLVVDTCTLGTSCAVTLSGSAVFTNSTSYTCTAEDETGIGATKVVQSSGSAFTITGTGTDVIRYSCAGN